MFKNIFKLVMPFFFLLLVAFSQNSYAQLSGSYTIPGAPFATVKSAFDSLNLVGVGSGGVTFNITAGYTESVTDSVLILKATGTSADPIIFQKSGAGTNPLITRTDAGFKTPTTLGAQGDAVIIIQGSDYVTFDGIDVAASNQGIEYGYYLRKASPTDGCKYVTIKNSVIDMTKGTSAFVVGIYSSNNNSGSLVSSATGITITSIGGRNEFVTLTGNTIQDVHAGIVLRGFNHTVTPNDFQDYNFVLGASGQGNTIQNYAGGNTGTTYGIYLINHTNPTVSYNMINNTGGGGANSTGQIYGIFMSATSATVNRGGDVVMNNNNITIGTSATGSVNSINIAPISTSITVNNNTFSFGTFASTTGSQIINVAQNAPTVTITGNQSSGTITKAGIGQLNCINYSGAPVNGVVVIANNNFSNISLAGSSVFNGIFASGSTTTAMQCYNNTFSNIISGTGTSYGLNLSTALTNQVYNNTINNITATGTFYGLSFSGTNPTVYNNTVYNITTSGTTVVGIYDQATGTTHCYKNQVYNLTSTNATASTSVGGIQITSGTSNNVYNNFISDLKIPNTTSVGNALFGINASASGATAKIGIYYNTIYLNSTGASAYRSFGIFSNTGSTSDVRNNIVVNTSTGIPIAYGRSTSALGTYSSLSDNNDFFATNIFFEGTGSTLYTTLAGYKTFVYPKDQATFSENPPFVNSTTAPYDLRINTSIATQTERGGRPVTTPVAINDDFDGNTRNSSFSDVGADEFSGTLLDLTAPIIAYTPFANTSSLSDRTLVVNVSDQAGVPATVPGWPNLYWKKGILGTYTAVQPTSVTGSDYTFNFGSGVVPTDTVFYYVVARDTVPTTPNLRAFPTLGAGNYTFDPPAAGTAPTSPNSYQVTSSSLTGDYTVGTALFNQVTGRNITFAKSGDKWVPMENGQRYYGDLYVKKIEHPEFNYPDGTDGVYLTLTAAIADLNLRGVSSPVNFLLTDASYTTASGEIFPYVVNITNEFKPTATNTVTIKPNTGVTPSIHGASPNSFIFKILSNYININGSNSGGTDRSLTIKNDTTYFPMVVSFASTGTTPITGGSLRNCIVTNGSNAMTSYTPAIILSNTNIDPANFTFTSGYFTNLTIQNNRIQKSDIGIYCYGVASAGNGNGVSINGNSLNDTTTNSIGNLGIQISGVDGASITNNNIGNIITPVSGGSLPTGIAIQSQTINTTISNNTIGPINITAVSSGPVGISINTGNANSNLIISNNTISGLRINQAVILNGITISGQSGGILINKNRIFDIKNTYVNATTAYGAYAITLGSSLTAANITLANNFIWDVAAYGRNSLSFHNGYGVYISGGGGYNLYHNTISLTTDQTLATGLPACINISSSITTPASLDIRNNIFANFQTVSTERYAIICNAANTVFANIDNNDYYTTGPNLGYLGSNRADLTAWKTATGKDVNSISANPRLVSANDLHADTNFDIVDGKGFYLATVPQDIDGDTRNNPSDLGADEYTYTPPVDPTDVTVTAVSDAQINVAFTPNVNNNNVVIVWNTTGTFTTPTGTPPAVDSAFAGGTVLYSGIVSPINHIGLSPVTTYYYKLFSFNGVNYSLGVAVSGTTLPVLDPTDVYAFAVGETQTQVVFTPNINSDSVLVVFNTWGTFETPTGTPPAIGDPFAGGTLLANSTTSPYSHTGLNANTTYYYKMFSYNGINYSSGVTANATTAVPPPGDSYTYNGGLGRYGTINLTTGAFTSWNFSPQGSSYYPVTADNTTLNSQYAIMSDFGFPPNNYLWHINFTTLTGDSIAPVGPLASGQNVIKGMAYNSVNNNWYVVSGNDLGSAAYLYTLNITTGALTVVGQIQNANLPVGMAIDCNGNGYIINVVSGASNTAVLNSLNLSTAVATAIGTDLGLANVTGFSQDMDIDPSNGNLYWSGYWSSGFFSEGGSFRLVNVVTGTSTEISTFGQYETITGFNVNEYCSLENPSAVAATAMSDVQVNVAFTPNTNNDNVVIVFNTWGTFETPSGPPPAIGDWFAGGTLVSNSTASPYNHIGLNPNTTYYYKLFSYNGTNYSPGVEVNATTLVPPPGDSYAYNGGLGRYGTINLTTGAFTSWNFSPQGSSYYPVTADNDSLNSQYAIMSDFAFPSNYYLWHINFTTLTGDSIAPIGPLASGQNVVKGMAYNKVTGTWYLVSGNDVGTAAYLYTLNMTSGALTVVGQIQNADLPVGIAIDCDGNAYIVNVVIGASSTAVLNSLNLSTAIATAIGTDLGLANVTGFSQDMDFNPDNGNLYWSGYWSSGWFSEGGSFRLIDETTGTSTQISTFGQYETITGFNVNGYCVPATTFALAVNVTLGWNMVSAPGLHPTDQNVGTWWTHKTGTVWGFNGVQYVSETVTTTGEGYWMKNTVAETYNYPAITIVPHNPIPATAGWNMMGGYETSPTITALKAANPQITGTVWGYNGSQYVIATNLVPGYGYWVKVSSAGNITIPDALAKGNDVVELFKEDWGRIILTDAAGLSYTLYAVKGQVDLSQYEMPPMPPSGSFDIRFSSGRIAEDINSSMQTIDMVGITYPLTVRVDGMDIRLMDESGKTINVNLKSGEDFIIIDGTINKLMVSGELIPAVYALEQNYPNPFNPSTVIEFSLPENVGNVKLSIYNALGEKVAELVNTALTAGKYQYQWNAQNVATGMYIYELRTDKFVSVKKMMLLK